MFKIPLHLLLARIALAFCFLGFGLWELMAPTMWTTYLPSFLKDFHPMILILTHGAALTISALGVLSGKWPKFFTGLSTLILLDICFEIFVQEGFTDVFIRDVALLLFTSGLFAQALSTKRS